MIPKITVINHRYGGTDQFIPGVAKESQDIVFCDAPYNIGVKYADDATGDKQDPDRYKGMIRQAVLAGSHVLRPGGTFWYLCPPEQVEWIPALLKTLVGHQLYMIVKEETFAQYQQKSLTEDYRLLFCFVKRPAVSDAKRWGKDLLTFNPDEIRIPSARLLQAKPDKRADPRGRVPGQIWKFRRLQGTSDDHVEWHPCQLPPELLHRIIKGWSNPGDKILDLFGGSGNFGLAGRLLGRETTLVDGSPTYCVKMKKRLGLPV